MLIVLLDDMQARLDALDAGIADSLPDADLLMFTNAPDMIVWIEESMEDAKPALISLDHDLGPTFERDGERIDPGDGRDVVTALLKHEPVCPVIVHTSNPSAGESMMFNLADGGWTAVRVWPMGGLNWVTGGWMREARALLSG